MGICVPQKKIGDHAMLFSFWFVFILPLSESFLFFPTLVFQEVYLTLLNMRVTFMRCVSLDILGIYRSISLQTCVKDRSR